MPVEILMPKLGLTMTEVKLIEWQQKEGDPVKAGEILFVLETEKVAYEVEAPEDGILGRIMVPQDQTVPVGTVVAYLLKSGETADTLPIPGEPAAGSPDTSDSKDKQAHVQTGDAPLQAPPSSRVRATPLAKKIARERGLDLQNITGTGPTGRIVADDVRNAQVAPSPEPTSQESGNLVPFTGMRQTIAKNMMSAKLETAQTYMSATTNATALKVHRQTLLPYIEKQYGVRLTITDLMMKVTGAAIEEHPVINTRWTDQGVLYLPTVHMGMAMSVDNGLVVPVIRDINSKNLGQIAKERTEVIDRVRQNRHLPDDIKGSTFTLSSLGMFGVESFTANINRPESAVLAVAAIIDKPVVSDGSIAIQPTMKITLTYDHRIIDGAQAAKFMQTLTAFIEEPIRILA